MKYPKGHIKATSLVETLTALTLIAVTFGIGMMVYAQVNRSNPLREQARAYPILQSVLEESIRLSDFKNSETNMNNLIIRKEVESYNDFANLYHIKVSAHLDEKELLSLDKLIFYKKDK